MTRVVFYKTIAERYDVSNVIVESLRKIQGDDECDIINHPLAIELFSCLLSDNSNDVILLSSEVNPDENEISIIGSSKETPDA